MSRQHPIIAVTGACGAGTTSVQQAFKEIFFRQKINAAFVEGDGFLRYDDTETEHRIREAQSRGHSLSCYGPDLNDFDRLEACFKAYGDGGNGSIRCKVNHANQHLHDAVPGGFTDWQDIPDATDCLFYEGMHGGVVAETWTRRKSENTQAILKDRRNSASHGVNAAQYVDLLIGVVPAINLEWIQRIHSDYKKNNHSVQQVTEHILQQMQDYIHFIVPQFSVTDINFQRMPVVDTSNPFDVQMVPTEKESIIVVSFREPAKYDLLTYAHRIDGAFLSRMNTLVIPGGQLQHALDVICAPLIEDLIRTGGS